MVFFFLLCFLKFNSLILLQSANFLLLPTGMFLHSEYKRAFIVKQQWEMTHFNKYVKQRLTTKLVYIKGIFQLVTVFIPVGMKLKPPTLITPFTALFWRLDKSRLMPTSQIVITVV